LTHCRLDAPPRRLLTEQGLGGLQRSSALGKELPLGQHQGTRRSDSMRRLFVSTLWSQTCTVASFERLAGLSPATKSSQYCLRRPRTRRSKSREGSTACADHTMTDEIRSGPPTTHVRSAAGQPRFRGSNRMSLMKGGRFTPIRAQNAGRAEPGSFAPPPRPQRPHSRRSTPSDDRCSSSHPVAVRNPSSPSCCRLTGGLPSRSSKGLE
jgi:hypothetical protein